MLNEIMLLAENAPITGDDFPAAKLAVVGGIAIVIAVGTAIFTKKNNKDDDD